MINGYNGKILRVNLSKSEISVEEPGEKFYRRYLGGRGFIAYYLLREVPPHADPLGPENKVIFAAGVLTGAPLSGSGRNSAGAKSPLTGAYGDGEAGGFWGAELKRAGYDAIIVEGVSRRPVYLWIHDGEAEIRSAEHLWGKETAVVQAAIQEELGDSQVRVAQIGPAGEALVRYACVVNDLHHFYGRCGVGAVMGSKKLRAIAVKGRRRPAVADAAALDAMRKWLAENDKLVADMRDAGTAGGLLALHSGGGLPTRNFREGQFEGAEKISGQTMRDTILVDRGSCYACRVRCKRVVAVKEGPFPVDPVYGGPEYETIGALGSNCGVDDLAAIAKGNELCAAYGLDTISTGVCIAFAMECYERGLLSREQADGLELRFGNAAAMVELVGKIARREGIGDWLAEGVRRAAARLGGEAAQYAMEVKGQELPMHEPRYKQGLGLGYAISPTGADHIHNIHDTAFQKEGAGMDKARQIGILEPMPLDDLGPDKVRLFAYWTHWRHMINSLGLCVFLPYDFLQTAEIVRAVTGWKTSVWELMKVGERVLTLTRLFNLREGLTTRDDYLPSRFHEPFQTGPLQGVAVNKEAFQAALQLYYGMMDWDERGAPSAERLLELDLGWAIEMLPR